MRKLATLQDIANRAEVNVSTVSRALNDSSEIKDETKEKIVKIARELNYVSNKSNNTLLTTNTHSIGMILPEIKSYSEVVKEIEKNIKGKGYSLIFGLTNFEYENEKHYLNLFLKKNVDGIICVTLLNKKTTEDLKEFREKYNIPVVLVETLLAVPDYDYIKIDDHRGVKMAVEHLLNLGHKKIGFIGEKLSKHRLSGYMETLKKYNIKIDKDLIKIGKERYEEGGYKRMNDILKLEQIPTAIFASYDDMAIGAIKAIYESGLEVPEDISVVGFDNVSVTAYLKKGLTTISRPVEEMGKLAVSILLRKIENKFKAVQNTELKPKLIVRETTDKLNK